MIQDFYQGNYDLMLLTDTKISDAVYCHNCLEYEIFCSEATVTAEGGAQGGGGRDCVLGETGGVDCQVNTLPYSENGELGYCC